MGLTKPLSLKSLSPIYNNKQTRSDTVIASAQSNLLREKIHYIVWLFMLMEALYLQACIFVHGEKNGMYACPSFVAILMKVKVLKIAVKICTVRTYRLHKS